MNQQTAFEVSPLSASRRGRIRARENVFEQHFIEQLLAAVRPEIKALIKEVIAGERHQPSPLVVDYEEAGRMIGTTYEGIRKLVRKGKLTAVSRSGRHRGIAVAELRDYVERSELIRDSGYAAGSNC